MYQAIPNSDTQASEMNLLLNNNVDIVEFDVITIVLNQIKLPPTMAELDGFIIKSQDASFYAIDIGPKQTFKVLGPNTDTSG